MEINRRAMNKLVNLLMHLGVDTWVAVTEATGGDTSEHVKISFSRMIIQILHATFDDHDWLFVEGKSRRANIVLAHLEHILIRWTIIGRWLVRIRWHLEIRQLLAECDRLCGVNALVDDSLHLKNINKLSHQMPI